MCSAIPSQMLEIQITNQINPVPPIILTITSGRTLNKKHPPDPSQIPKWLKGYCKSLFQVIKLPGGLLHRSKSLKTHPLVHRTFKLPKVT